MPKMVDHHHHTNIGIIFAGLYNNFALTLNEFYVGYHFVNWHVWDFLYFQEDGKVHYIGPSGHLRFKELDMMHILSLACHNMPGVIVRFCPDISTDTLRIPSNTRCWINVGLLLVQRRRRWPNNKPALVQRLVFAGSLLLLAALVSSCLSQGWRIQEEQGSISKQIDLSTNVVWTHTMLN